MQSPGEGDLMKFFGAAAPQYRRFAPVKGGSGVPTPARLTRGTNEPKGEIWATGRILLSKNRGFSRPQFSLLHSNPQKDKSANLSNYLPTISFNTFPKLYQKLTILPSLIVIDTCSSLSQVTIYRRLATRLLKQQILLPEFT